VETFGAIFIRKAGLTLGLAFLLGVVAWAQGPSPSHETPKLQQNPLAELVNTQPGEGEEYELGGGDVIDVAVVGRPELSGQRLIGPDGRITMPIVGSVSVGNMSRDAAAAVIENALGKFYVKPVVTLQVDKYGSNQVSILGDIEHPQVLSFDGPPTLLEAITRGGKLIGSDKTQRMPTTCIIYRGRDQIGTINLKDAFRMGDVRLRRNDVVYIPGDQERLISVLGEVRSPGPFPLRDESSVISLITDAGGITPEAGNPDVQIINPATGTIQRVSFKDMLRNRGKDVTLAVGDIIYVPRSGISHVGFFLQQIAPAAQIGTIGSLATQ
jgi:polysaccharide export outer membrane protein